MSGNVILNIVILICTGGIGFFSLLKDWQNHKHPVRQYSVLGFLCAALVAGIWSLIVSNNLRQTEKAQADEKIKGLQGQLSALSDKVNALPTNDKTEELKSQIAELQESLKGEISRSYQPSIAVGSRFEQKRAFIDVHNLGPTSIQVIGTEAFNKVCIFPEPVTVTTGQSAPLEEEEIASRVVNTSGEREMAVYFKTEDKKTYRARVMFERHPSSEEGMFIHKPKVDLIPNLGKEVANMQRTCS
jgi:hypothetical protein